METQFLKYQKLFTEFNKLDKMEDTFVTFMELSGYPHFENVCSNILIWRCIDIPAIVQIPMHSRLFGSNNKQPATSHNRQYDFLLLKK